MTDIKYYFFCAFFLSTLTCFGQRRDTLTIYYPINDFQLKIEAQSELSNAISAPHIKTIQVLGYADYLGSAGYDLVLSTKRAEAVKSFLTKNNGQLIVAVNGKGRIDEAVKVKTGDPKNRKVEIVIDYEQPAAIPAVVTVDTIKKETPTVNLVPPQNDVVKDTVKFGAKVDSLFKGGAGTSITINELNFIGGTHTLTPRSSMYLPVLLNSLLKYSNIKIKILGHICCVFDGKDGHDYDSKNDKLSENRAKAIYDYLTAHGVSSHRMSYKGMGSSQPKVYPELTNEDSDLNRRVEIIIVSD